MVEVFLHPGSPIGEAGKADDTEPESPCLYAFQNSAHADGICADCPQHPNFCRSLILRAAQTGLYPLAEFHAPSRRSLPEILPPYRVIGHAHIDKFRPGEWARAGEIEMV